MLPGLHMLEAHEPDLHREQHPKNIHRIISHVQPHRIPPCHEQHQHVKRHEIDDKHVPAPRRHHIEVTKSGRQPPRQRAGVDGLHKEVEGEEEGEDGDALIVVRSGDGAGDVAGADGDERGCDEADGGVVDLGAEEVGDEGGVCGEEGGGEDADLADVDGEAEEVEDGVEEGGGEHEAGVEGAADDAAERVPGLEIEPVPELLEAVADEVESGAVVEVGVELVDHGLVAEDAEEADGEGEDIDEEEDGEA